jgi:hypothetical protein
VVKWSIVQTIITIIVHEKWEIFHFNIKTMFLNGDLKEEVYRTQPKRFVIPGQEITS